MATLTDKQLTALISNWRKKNIDGPFYGIRTDQAFSGNPHLEIDGQTFDVAECRSDLEARELLSRAGGHGLVMLFRVDHQRLGEDLLARLAKERLLSVDVRQSLRELFQAATVDPRINTNQKLVEALVAAAADRGGVNAPVGVLDMELAWSVLLNRPEITVQRPDLGTLLKWSLSDDDWSSVRDLEPEVCEAFFDWVAERAGEAAKFIEAAAADSHCEILVPIGLVLGLLFQGGSLNVGEQLEGRVRIESYLGKRKIAQSPAMAWYLAAAAVTKDLAPGGQHAVARRVDDLLKALNIEGLAIHSDFSEAGFGERIKSFAEQLAGYGRRKSEQAGADLASSFQAVRNHVLAGDPKHKERLLRAEMAIRLAVWLKQLDPNRASVASLEEMLDSYLAETSFVDRARFALFGGDAADPGLSQAYHQLGKQAGKIRLQQQRDFGGLLASWIESGGHGKVLPVEDVIEEVVVPLAKVRPVLLLVLDGMSGPVFHELIEDFAQREWTPLAQGQRSYARPVVAALPSITEVSRKGLFSGKLDHSGKRTEQVAFRDHPSLAHAGTKTKPQLFLKGDLSDPGQSFLSDTLREMISSPSQRVVGVLLNVVDDQLTAADQLEVQWRINRIRFLEPILEAASQAERIIVLTSDHGHVPELNQTTKTLDSPDGGDRYRKTGSRPAGNGELLVQGKRIQAATGEDSLIVGCEETVRYGGKKGGYHGGAADLEVVIPLAVLDSTLEVPEGWLVQDPSSPSWWRWRESLGLSGDEAAKPILKRVRAKAGKGSKDGDELPLFSGPASMPHDETAASGAWIKSLIASPVFKQQSALIGKVTPKNDQIAAFLTAIASRGNSVLLPTLAADLKLPLFRLRGLISSLSRLFNVDGYAVIEEDRESETIRLDRRLLAKQFETTE